MFIPFGVWSTVFELLMVKRKFTAPDHVSSTLVFVFSFLILQNIYNNNLTEINVVLLFSASRHKGVWENGGVAPRIMNLGAAVFSLYYAKEIPA